MSETKTIADQQFAPAQMTSPKPGAGTVNYPFVDWIRMIAMIGIIWAHTPNFEGGKNFPSLDNIPLYFFFMDFFKFGVICFFMISGFLLSRKIGHSSPVSYFKNRIYSTLFPYLVAFGLIVLLFIFKTQLLHQESKYTVGEYIVNMFFESALWFLPNYWISLIVILCFVKYLNKLSLGMFLLVVTLVHTYYFVYSIYAQSHVHALFAFIFYLWLGYIIGKRHLHLRIKEWNVYLLLGLCVLSYICTSMESVVLYQHGSNEPMNILRMSNQVYSVLAFVTMVRLFKNPISTKWVNPRKETFGIYLYHMFPLALLAFGLKFLSKFGINTYSSHTPQFILWFLIKFLIVYMLTLICVKILIRYNLGFLNYVGKAKS